MRLPLILTVMLLAATQVAAATLDRIHASGTIRIGYRTDAKPYSYSDELGQPTGYIVDLCREIAAAIQPRPRTLFVPVSAGQRFEAVRDGRVDILCEATSVTMARREVVDFSLPTFFDGAGVISRTGAPVESFEDMAGKRVGVLENTTSEETLRRSLTALHIDATVVPVHDHRAGLDILSDDKIDAYFADHGIAAAMQQDGSRPGFQISKRYFSYETYALALPKDDGAFRLFVDRTLARLYRTDKVKALLQKTFGRGSIDGLLQALIVMNSLPDK